jgi:hypothetical protein
LSTSEEVRFLAGDTLVRIIILRTGEDRLIVGGHPAQLGDRVKMVQLLPQPLPISLSLCVPGMSDAASSLSSLVARTAVCLR